MHDIGARDLIALLLFALVDAEIVAADASCTTLRDLTLSRVASASRLRIPPTAGSGRTGVGSPTIDQRFLPATENDIMGESDDWSPDEPSGTEAFEQGDEAFDEGARLDPDLVEATENDPSLDPVLQVDERELQEAGADFDDPEVMATLAGGGDDPDGLGGPPSPSRSRREDEDGWYLDAPSVRSNESDTGQTD